MNILYIVPYVPSQIYVRPYNLIKSLAARGHQVDLLTLAKTEDDFKAIQEIQPFCRDIHHFPLQIWRSLLNCILALPTSTPLQAAYSWQPEAANLLDRLLDQNNDISRPEIIHVEHLRGANYGLHVEKFLAKGPDNRHLPIIWDSVDCITYLFKQASVHTKNRISRWLTRFDLSRTAQYEARLVGQFDHILVTSHTDKQALSSLQTPELSNSKISIIPNGVDLDYFHPDIEINRESDTLVLTGKMSYHANITTALYLVNEIMPIVWAKKPTAKLWIVGKDPPKSITILNSHPAITVTGTVKDVRPFLQGASIAVTPLTYGAGMQNKVLQAMACATPVVSSSIAINSLSVERGREVLVGDSAQEVAQGIIDLLDNPALREHIGQAGRRYVESHHQWSQIAASLEEIYLNTIVKP